MSIQTEITRLQTAKADIKTAIELKGVNVPSSATIDTYDDYVSQIVTGGGGSSSAETALAGMIDRSITEVVIPSGVTEIGNNAFQSCSSLTSITIPSSVTKIGDSAFANCYSLSSVTISNSVRRILSYAFQSCSSLTTIVIPASIVIIYDYILVFCSNLQSITIEKTTPPTLYGNHAFDRTNECNIYVPAAAVTAYQSAEKWSAYASRIQAIPE